MMDIQTEAAVGVRFRRAGEKILAATTLFLAAGLMYFSGSMDLASYGFFRAIMPGLAWVFYFTILGTARIVFLTVNGHYPLGAQVRAILSFVTLFTVWTPLSAAFAWNLVDIATNHTGGQFFPGAALAPACMSFEGLSLFALATLWRTKRDAQRRYRAGDRSPARSAGGGGGGVDRQPQEQAALATA